MLTDVSSVAGSHIPQLRKLGLSYIRDLCFYMPSRYIDRTSNDICAPCGTIITVVVRVDMHFPPKGKGFPYRILCKTDDHCLTLVFFQYSIAYLKAKCPIDVRILVSGKLSNDKCIIHPDYIGKTEKLHEIAILEPVYKTVRGLSSAVLGHLIRLALKKAENFEEWWPEKVLNKLGGLGWLQSLNIIHNSTDERLINAAIERIACDELALYLCKIEQLRKNIIGSQGLQISGDGRLRKLVMEKLGFELTDGQKAALCQIYAEQSQPSRMMQLIQGDVGCGKTLVALMAILNAVECGFQAVLMAPTEVLAQQHSQWFCKCIGECEQVALITGAVSRRATILDGLQSGKIKILVGTHAVIGEKICFKNLALVVIDEQQRFGVDQRAKLISKGEKSDVLMMSATPIPRSLNMVLNGDLGIIKIEDKPKGRKAVKTLVYNQEKIDELVERIKCAQHKVFWICPLIEESDGVNATDVNTRFQYLANHFTPAKLGIVHGKASKSEKDQVLFQFKNAESMVLVATTVIEVGLDVQDADIVVIENAERFGLAQLHQLRGRVGRGDLQSYCVLLYSSINPIACQRLKVLKECDDGFEIAERDLEFRGGGDPIGLKQSGWPKFWFFDPIKHKRLYNLVDRVNPFPEKYFDLLGKIFERGDDKVSC